MAHIPPPLLCLSHEEAYKAHFCDTLVHGTITTFHGVPVQFKYNKFSHAFFESTQHNQNKDLFSLIRAERMDWIKPTLECRDTDWYQGWSTKRQKHEIRRSVSVAYENFVVVLQYFITGGNLAARFITCYEADKSIEKIQKSPLWNVDDCRIDLGIENGH